MDKITIGKSKRDTVKIIQDNMDSLDTTKQNKLTISETTPKTAVEGDVWIDLTKPTTDQ